MDDTIKRQLMADNEGLLTYEYIANHIGQPDLDMDFLVDNIIRADHSGQFIVSAARYLHAIDSAAYSGQISRLAAAAIECDRTHSYIGQLLPTLWGEDYHSRKDELSAQDDNFRRIYKRLFPGTVI